MGLCLGFCLLFWLPGTTAFVKFSDWGEEPVLFLKDDSLLSWALTEVVAFGDKRKTDFSSVAAVG